MNQFGSSNMKTTYEGLSRGSRDISTQSSSLSVPTEHQQNRTENKTIAGNNAIRYGKQKQLKPVLLLQLWK